MAHYAFLDENNIVTEVIVGRDEWEVVDGITDWEKAYSEVRNQPCKRTSYNTVGGVNVAGGTAFRKNYAGVGYRYDEERGAFIAPKPHPSWILDEETCVWNPPIPYPTDDKIYNWNESTLSWDEVIK